MRSYERFKWAAQVLNIRSGDCILEMGCGVGLAIEAMTPLLKKGKITAIDRSTAMIAKAIQRNQEAIGQNKAGIFKTELLGFSDRTIKYNKIFCFNINFFWTQKSIEEEAKIFKSLLAKPGLLYVFYGPMVGNGFEKTANLVSQNLQREKFKIIKSIWEEQLRCCCFIASPDS